MEPFLHLPASASACPSAVLSLAGETARNAAPRALHRAPAASTVTPPRTPEPVPYAREGMRPRLCAAALRAVIAHALDGTAAARTDEAYALTARQATHTGRLLMHDLFFPPSLETFEKQPSVRVLVTHAAAKLSTTPTNDRRTLRRLGPSAAVSTWQGDTVVHALLRNTRATAADKRLCLRDLAAQGCDLAARNVRGEPCAGVAARQAGDSDMILRAIDAWDPVAFVQRGARGVSVADAVLAHPVTHLRAFAYAPATPQMQVSAQAPKAWLPPPLRLTMGRHLGALVAKPHGSCDVDGSKTAGPVP